MDLTLGLAMSANAVSLLVAHGADGCGVTLDHDEFAPSRAGGVSTPSTSEHVVAAVLGTQAMAAARRHTLVRVGITWTEELDTEAWLVLEALQSLGIRNVVPVPMLDAAEAFACRLAEQFGRLKTAVFIVESDSAIATTVTNSRGAISHVISQIYRGQFIPGEAPQSLVGSMYSHLTDEPDALFVARAGGDFDWIAAQFDDVTRLPVMAAPEAELALARGAAIASKRPALAIVSPAGERIKETRLQGDAEPIWDDEPVWDDEHSAPLLFVPRSARLAVSEPTPESVATPALSVLHNRRAVTSANVLTAVLMGAAATFAVAVTLTFTDRSASISSPTASAAERAVSPSPPIRQPDDLIAADQPAAPTAQPLTKSSLNGTLQNPRPSVPPVALAGAAPAPSVSPTQPAATSPTAETPAVPDVFALLASFVNSLTANPNAGTAPSRPQLLGPSLDAGIAPDSSVTVLHQPFEVAIPDPAKVPIPDLSLLLLPNSSGIQQLQPQIMTPQS